MQTLISKVFAHATSSIRITGSEVIPTPLFSVLDGKNGHDYCARVEPSAQGGQKMARLFLDLMEGKATGDYGATAGDGECGGAMVTPPGGL